MNRTLFRPRRFGIAIALTLAGALALVGCAGDNARSIDLSKSPPPGQARLVSDHYRLIMRYPETLGAAHGFASDRFLGKRWNSEAAAGVPGAALLSLTLPGSNDLRSATLRLGASDDTRAVDNCLNVRTEGNARQVTLSGVSFVRVAQRDAGMGHYQRLRRYRAVRAHQCIAIDLFVTGTERGVYGPGNAPPEPPFSPDAGIKRLTGLLDGLVFMDTR